MPAAPTIAQPPRITADEIPQMLDSPQFAALPHARRSQLLESALASGVEDVAGQWDKTRYQQWGQFADTARSKVASMESLPEKAAYYGRVVGGAVKDSVATIGAGVAGISPVLPDGQGGAAMQMPGKTLFQMLGANVAGLATGVADKLLKDAAPVEAELDTLKQQIDQGAFFDHEKGFTGWVDDAAAKLEKAQKAYYGDEDWARENSVLANPQNAQALSAYMRTRDPAAWGQLRDQVLKTPGMQRIGAEKDKLSTESTLGKAMTPEAQRYIQEAADPAEILGTVAGVGAGVKAAKAGQTVLQRTGKLAAGVGVEVASEQVSAFMDNPNMSWEQRAQVAKDALAAGLGFAGIGAAPQMRLPKRNATPQQTASAGSIDNPFAGPIEAPPQPTETGGVVPPAGPQPVPAFTDNPLGTVAPQPAGGNVLIDYGIPRTPQAQAQVDAAQEQVAQSQAAARGQQNMAGNRMPLIPDNPLGYRDILDFVNDNPLNIPRKGSDAATAAEYDWTRQYEMPQYYRKFLASSERGFNASDLADMAFKEGYIQDASPDALLEKIDKTIRERTQFKVEFRKQQLAQNDESRRLLSFDKAQQQASRVESTQLPLDAVVPGDSFTLKGEDVIVKQVEYDEDGRATLVQIEDGKKFGVLNLDPQTRGAILVDEFKPQSRDSGGTRPPSSEPDPFMRATPRLSTNASVTKDSGATADQTAQNTLGAGLSPATGSISEELAMAAPAVAGPLPSGYQGALPQMPTAQQPWTGKVQTLHGIRQFLLDAVGLPAVGVKRFTKAALGIYKIKPEAVRLQAINDIPVLAHEIGHHVHYRFLSATPSMADDWNGRHDAELMPLGRPTSTPQYTPDQVRKEGVAEFTRLWLTNPVQARAQAPAFSAFWEQELQAKAPQIAEGLRTAQGQIADYIAMPAFEKAKAQIVFDPAAERQDRSLGDKLRTIYAQMFNTLQPALDVTRQAAQMDPTLADQAADVEMWMENHRGGWASKANSDVFGQQTDLNGQVTGPGLQTILKDLQPGENTAFSAYLALKRAQELEGRGLRSGFEQARLPGAEMRTLEARFEPTRKKLQRWMKNERNLLVQAGLLDVKSAQAMDDANADYVPFYRLYEKLNGVSFGPEQSKNSGGYVDLNSGIRAIKGSDRAIIDPLQSAMKNAFMFRKLAEQNLIGVKFFDLVREVQGGGQWGETIRPKMKPVVTSHDAIVQKLIDEGVIKDASMLPQNADLTLRLFQAITKPDTKNGEVIIFKDGKREHWEIKDPMLMQALKTADADAVKLGNIPSWMLKVFTLPTRALRWGATGGPWFAIPNFLRDSVQGGVMSRSGGKGFVPFVDSLKGALEIMRKGGAFEQWKQAGGEFSGVVTGTQAFTSLLEDALPKDNIARRAMAGLADPKAWRGGFRNALSLVGALGKFTEESTRLGEFMRAKREGASDPAAANLSKIVSLNFARAGEVSRVINQFVPFFNATLQGLDQLVRAHADPKVRTATIIKGLSYITLPSVLVWALGKDDEEIQNLPDYRKNLFWNINLKPMAAALGMPEAGFILSIPKPFLLGAIYGTSVERALDYATGRDPNGARKAVKNLLANTMNPFDVMMSIGGIRPIIEATTNYSLFTGRDIVPEAYTHLPKEQQYSVLTSQTARMLGRFTGQSPMMIDHLLRGYFATAGQFGADAIDYGMAKLALTDVPPPPRKGMMELPILNRFAASPYAANAYVSRFYDASSDMEGKLAVFNKQAEQMTSSEQQKWFAANREELGHYLRIVDSQTGRTGAGDIRAAQRTLSELNAARQDIQASRVLTPEVKRARMIELTTQRNGVAENAYNQLFPAEVRKRHY